MLSSAQYYALKRDSRETRTLTITIQRDVSKRLE